MIKAPKAIVFRRLWLKRRLASTGLFETNWQDISSYVIKWGSIKQEVDALRPNRFRQTGSRVTVYNGLGTFNPQTDASSLWYGYAHRQRSLIKFEAGFIDSTTASTGVITNTEYPTDSTQYIGLLSGDMSQNDRSEAMLDIMPLTQVFVDYPATQLPAGAYTTTGVTAGRFMQLMRDLTDGASQYVFRPFFNDTTTWWNFTSSGLTYSNLANTASVIDMSIWDIIQQLAEAENVVPFIGKTGIFNFIARNANTTTAAFQFFGAGSYDGTYGHTIKNISNYGPKLTKYYSKVQIEYATNTFVNVAASFAVGGNNNAWNLGLRALNFDNVWIQNSGNASTLATAIFNDYSSLKDEIEMVTSFVPHLAALDRINVTYDGSDINLASLWDSNNWDTELTWDASAGLQINAEVFKILSVELDLDKFETKIIGREI